MSASVSAIFSSGRDKDLQQKYSRDDKSRPKGPQLTACRSVTLYGEAEVGLLSASSSSEMAVVRLMRSSSEICGEGGETPA